MKGIGQVNFRASYLPEPENAPPLILQKQFAIRLERSIRHFLRLVVGRRHATELACVIITYYSLRVVRGTKAL